MALFRKFFYRKPPEGLLEISERVFVFSCCFTTNLLEGNEYQVYIGHIVDQLREYYPDASFTVHNFGDENHQSLITNVLSDYGMTLINYSCQYENSPLLTLEMIHSFLSSSDSWLSDGQRNVILMHCQNGALPVLAFMLAAFLIYRKQYSEEQKTLEMIYKQAPHELLQSLISVNPLPSQLRYLQYVSRRNIDSQWPPVTRALTLDCVILKGIPNMDGEGGCRPIFRIYGSDPFMASNRTTRMLFSMPKESKALGYFKQADSELVKIDINCHVQGDVVLECITLDDNLEHEEMMFRVMFNTAFITSNILILNLEEIDISWNVKDQFPNDFRAEVLFSEMDSSSSLIGLDLIGTKDKEGLPIEACSKFQDMFSSVGSGASETDIALTTIQQMTVSSILQEKPEITSPPNAKREKRQNVFPQSVNNEGGFLESSPKSEGFENDAISPPAVLTETLPTSSKSYNDLDYMTKKMESSELQVSVQRHAQSKIISPRISQNSLSNPASYSNSLQVPPVPLSRYRSSTSALGITALLHDHVEFSHREVSCTLTPEVSISASAPCLPKPVQPTNSFVPPSEQHPSEKHYINSKSESKASPPPPPLPLSLSTRLLTAKPQLRQPSPQLPSSVPPPPPPPPIKSTCQLYASELSGSPPKQPVSSSSKALSPPPPPPPLPPPPSLQSSLPSSPTPSPHPSSVTAAHPSLPNTLSNPPPPPPLPPLIRTAKPPSLSSVPSPPPPPPPSSNASIVQNQSATTPSPPTPLPEASSSTICQDSSLITAKKSTVPAAPSPPCPPQRESSATVSTSRCSASAPTCSPSSVQKEAPARSRQVVPPPPAPLSNGLSKSGGTSLQLHSSVSNPLGAKGKLQLRTSTRIQAQSKKTSLRPYHWLKLTRAMQGSLWAEAQKPEEASKVLELDMSELESLFSTTVPKSDHGGTSGKTDRRGSGLRPDKVHLIELRRAYNCEIMLTKVKVPLSDLMNSVLALDDSALDIDQVDNLIKFCPTKEEMELLKNYNGDKENLGKCEQFFLELMKVPRVESKLRVFSFRIQFCSQVSDLRNSLNIVNSASEEVRSSVKLKRIMQTILSLGNALNHGTARGSAVGFRLDSLLKLSETRARNNKLTLIHYLCKVLAEKLPEVLDFHEDLVSLEAATKIQLKYLAEEMQAITKGLEKVAQELTASENDGAVSEHFCKTLKEFSGSAEAEVRSLASIYSVVGRNADALALYFGEDPARCPFEQVVSTLLNFVRMFRRAHEENCKQLEFEKKKAQKEAENGKAKTNPSRKELEMRV